MISWVIKKFDDLKVHELYAIHQLRNEVFVVEQNCVYQDADNKDQGSFHLMGWLNHKLVAYCRILPKGIAYPDHVSIGRVVTSSSVRRSGTGKELMQQAIIQINKFYGIIPIKIGAQVYLQKFYSSFGFQPTSEIYFEDRIEHIEMIRP
jgi:ElaA protein